jgi:hypothetical protein
VSDLVQGQQEDQEYLYPKCADDGVRDPLVCPIAGCPREKFLCSHTGNLKKHLMGATPCASKFTLDKVGKGCWDAYWFVRVKGGRAPDRDGPRPPRQTVTKKKTKGKKKN